MRLLYFILLIAAAVFYPLYRDDLSFYTLAALLIVPVMMLAELTLSRFRVKAELKSETISSEKGKTAAAKLVISNRSIFPLPNTRVNVEVRYSACSEKSVLRYSVPVPSKKTETVSINIRSAHCGRVDVKISSIRIYDVLRLFSAGIPVSGEAHICVIPPLEEINADNESDVSWLSSADRFEEESNASPKAGADPTEVIGYREFRSGDRMSRINYKLSSRFDKDIVREMGSDEADKLVLIPDMLCSMNDDGTIDPELADLVLTHTLRLANAVLSQGVSAYLYLWDSDTVTDDPVIPAENGLICVCGSADELMSYAASAAYHLSPDIISAIPCRLPSGFCGAAVTTDEHGVPDGFFVITLP
ncbi:MAG: DUF58 domain-containing protein [Huintestinicola sp.]